MTTVEISDIAVDGGLGASFAALGNTMKLTTATGQTTDFNIEEQDDPILTINTKGSTTLSWECYDVSAAMLQKLFGGTVAAGPPAVWSAPDKIVAIEKSLRITAASGQVIAIVRASVYPTFNWNFTKTDIASIQITATILTPTKASTAPFTVTDHA
jgi:hypothetical protein